MTTAHVTLSPCGHCRGLGFIRAPYDYASEMCHDCDGTGLAPAAKWRREYGRLGMALLTCAAVMTLAALLTAR